MEAVHGLGLDARVGVEAGEVVADESESTFATGEAVNVAARLQQLAAPGEILLGPLAHRLTRAGIEVEDRGSVDLKGLGSPVPVQRLVRIVDSAERPQSVRASFVGREEELELLHTTFARTIRDRRAHLFTIYGEPGVGKSRLAREFVDGVEGATILVGRALPYGEGITYWPIAEMVKVAAGITDDDPVQQAVSKLRAACGDDAVADLLALAVGVLEGIETERSQQEIAWAAREWAAELASAQPLILVFEDIHWSEDPLLELVEHLAERVKDAPLLVICLARPELLDLRPGWGGGRVRATAIELEPLQPAESEELVEALLADRDLSVSERRTLLDKTEGNPLFVEETIRVLLDGGASSKRIPDTVQAMIAARIDRLPRAEKAALQRASVIGRIFWRGSLERLAPELELEPVLAALLERDFITAREPLDDLRRARIPVQARPDPRRRVLRPDQERARRAAPARRGVAAGPGRRGAARDPGLPPRPGSHPARGARRPRAGGAGPCHCGRPGGRGPARARPRGEPRRASPASARTPARAHPRTPLPGREGGGPARRPPGLGGGDERRLRGGDPRGRRAPPGVVPRRARGGGAPARRRAAARARARRAGARPPRRRGSGGSVRGALGAGADLLVARRPRRRRALDRQGARDRARRPGGRTSRRARSRSSRALRSPASTSTAGPV